MDFISALLGGNFKRRKRAKDLLTVEVKIHMDCEGCERKVKNSVSSMEATSFTHITCIRIGVKSVEVNRSQSRLTVTGNVDAQTVLETVKAGTGKGAELWPYVPYKLVYYPYAPNTYDKKASPGYVRKVEYALSTPNREDEKYTTLFSEDNANACTIM